MTRLLIARENLGIKNMLVILRHPEFRDLIKCMFDHPGRSLNIAEKKSHSSQPIKHSMSWSSDCDRIRIYVMNDETLSDAERFLAPILNKSAFPRTAHLWLICWFKFQGSRGDGKKSIIDILSSEQSATLPNELYPHRRKAVIKKALDLLSGLHNACCRSPQSSDQRFASHRNQKVTDPLLDLVVVEGIYPCLSIGVGVPIERRITSVIKGDLVSRPLSQHQDGQSHDQELTTAIIDCLYPILSSRKGLASNIESRMLADLIAAVGQAAFSPDYAVETRQKYLAMFDSLLDR